ncbi:aldehyde dehydrogenase (NADP(+)) [Marinobacter salarius]|uniref:aldehyde dehydrogenase (NADP(+)) n=1 Tax=Marinobacter salarius TaxID=1420917 RepID=UPI00273AFDFE|nr:aldehyde dehydrogenase (NADP(+)) [Marinobacter salarius]MDP4531006.1 aldehyde dehydrogenase (NADP(+)) [Marinobacter salarius]
MTVSGHQLIGQISYRGDQAALEPIDPATGERLEPDFPGASKRDIEQACSLALEAFGEYRETSLEARASFLETIATEIEALGPRLIERAMAETGLPKGRIEGERGRTCGQLRLFASVVRDGEWLDVRVDPALPERQPMPRLDLRQRHIAVGPVAVFGASNFPLAFSVAGGDTASALAAGCPVVVKGHPAHPGTSELVGRAIQQAAKACQMPNGVFSLLFGVGNEIGQALVANPCIQAVGFTGSRRGGLALTAIAQQRSVPIPVFAEMSSINPVFLLPEAVATRASSIAKDFAASLNMGAGQFCTNPGLIIGCRGKALDAFQQAATDAVAQADAQTMLTPDIHAAYTQGIERLSGHAAVQCLASGQQGVASNTCQPQLFSARASDFLTDETLQQEVFGAASLIIECEGLEEMQRVAESLEGQLTATLHMDEGDMGAAQSLLPILETKAGRILVNGWPTGVEVCHAMVHGGPFPATSDSRTTSVGSAAIRRFLRPVCYQNFPDALRPHALKEANPYRLHRLLDGEREA